MDMTKMKGFRKLLAAALCLCLTLGNGVLARAEEPEVTVEGPDEDGKYDVTVDIPGDTGSIKVASGAGSGFAIKVDGNAVDPNNLTRENVDSVTVNVENAGQITNTVDKIGIDISVYNPIDVTVNANDSKVVVTGGDDEFGLYIYDDPMNQSQDGNKIDVQVGDIEVQSDGRIFRDPRILGMTISGTNGSDINVDADNVTASYTGNINNNGSAYGISVSGEGSAEITVSAENVTAEDRRNAYGMNIVANDNSQVTVAVLENDKSGGDVIATGSENAIGIRTVDKTDSSVNLYIEGTVFGSTVGVDLDAHTEMAAWQIAAGDGGTVIKRAPNPVNYLIKLGEGLTNENVSTADHKTVTFDREEHVVVYGDETATKEYAYHTAVEEEDVTLSFQLRDEEEFEGVYYNAEDKDEDGKVNEEANLLTVANGGLTKQEDGSLLLKMLRGGGMLLGLKIHTHSYEFDSTIAPATCTEAGEDLYKCSACGAEQKRAVQATGHTEVKDASVPATTEKTGLTEGSHCSVCGAVIKAQQVVDKLQPEPEPEEEPEEEPEDESDDEPAPPAITTILKIIDKTGKTEIIFQSNGTYKAAYEDGTSEKGHFSLKDGAVVLVNDGDAGKTEMVITLNPDTGKYDLAFSPSGDAGTAFAFEIEESDVNILIRNRS